MNDRAHEADGVLTGADSALFFTVSNQRLLSKVWCKQEVQRRSDKMDLFDRDNTTVAGKIDKRRLYAASFAVSEKMAV